MLKLLGGLFVKFVARFIRVKRQLQSQKHTCFAFACLRSVEAFAPYLASISQTSGKSTINLHFRVCEKSSEQQAALASRTQACATYDVTANNTATTH